MKTIIYNSFEIPQRLENFFESLDSYASPYFMLLNFHGDAQFVEKLAQDATLYGQEDNNNFEEKVYNTGSLILSEDLVFLSMDTEAQGIKKVVNRIIEFMEDEDIKVYISVFCHNCLGDAKETFRWCTQLLDKTIENANENSAFMINDFTDKENWSGLNEYTK